MSKKTKSLVASIIAIVIVAALAVGAYALYQNLKPQAQEGSKTVSIIVTNSVTGESLGNFEYKTDVLYLADLLKENAIAEFSTSEYGEYIESVCKVAADSSASQYWAMYVNGEYGQYGASEQPVTDGDTFELKLESWQ